MRFRSRPTSRSLVSVELLVPCNRPERSVVCDGPQTDLGTVASDREVQLFAVRD